MSEVKVNKVSPRSGTTLTIGDSGDTTNVVGTLQNNGAALVGDISSVVAGTNLSGGGTSGAVTINLADASTSAKGAASFSSDNFAASSGAVTIKDLGIATAEIQDNAITLAKMASGTDGNIISYDASGNPVAIATGSDGQVLTSAGAGAQPAFETPSGVSLSGSTNNQVATVTGANALTGESNLLFTGNTLTVGASDNGIITATYSLNLNVGGGEMINFATTNSVTLRMRIVTGGNVLIGDVTDKGDNTGRLQVTGRPSSNIARFRAGTNGEQISFHNANNDGQAGTITVNESSTAYNTSSDYRLKENVDYTFDATTRLKQLKPARFNWIADEDNTLIDGFIAHEVSSVVPEAVTGIHNAVEVWKDNEELPEGVSVGDNKLDDDGNTIPKYQGIDQAKLVPLLVKTIQELEARITTLENA